MRQAAEGERSGITTVIGRFRAPSAFCVAAAMAIVVFFAAGCPPPKQPPGTPSAPPANGQAILGWGGNSAGQIGDGSTSQRLSPVLIQLPNLKAIAAGDLSMAVTTDGRVFEWGGGKNTPTEVAGLTSVKQIAVGERHRLALKEDGTVWAWGENDKGQLGDGTTTARPTPVQVAGLTNAASIAAGGRHSLAIKTDLSVVSWGFNNEGQLGDGTKNERHMPVAVPGIQAIEVAASTSHSLALTSDLKLMGWGRNVECQLGVDPRNDPFDPIVCSEHTSPVVVFESGTAPFPSSTGRAIAAMSTASLVVLSILNRTGQFWQHEPFDRYIRSAKHFSNVIRYIENNPVKAGLCEMAHEWFFSSAYEAVRV